jgi:hypothetical protein
MLPKRIYAAWFGIHFFLITAVCLAGVLSLVAEGATVLPSSIDPYARKAQIAMAWLLGKQADSSNRVRQAIATYLHAAGIQAGYTFFAPNVPSHHRLTLELFYEDGHIEYASPQVRSKAAALRLETLLDKLPEERYEPAREVVLKMLASSIWREHPDVKRVRAIFETVHLPGVTEFEHGKRETLEPLFSFDFSLRGEEQQ